MKAEIITVGTELLLGDIPNSNSQFLSQELAVYGVDMLYQSTVGDNNDRLEQVLHIALERSDLVLITGGLGPTPDDLTKETVSQVLGVPLTLHEESWQRIEAYFSKTGRPCADNNRKQAMLPENCVVFPNDHGTAPGCAIEKDGKSVVLLPGPPRELIPMMQRYVSPYLSRFSGGTIYSCTIGVFGLPEATVAERLADLLSGANPTVAPYAQDGEVVLRVTAHAADLEAARLLCEPIVKEIQERLGSFVYGVDAGSLQQAVMALLQERGLKIATAESCTAGLLSERLTKVAGASSVFECGVAAYSKEIKQQVLGVSKELLDEQGAVCSDVACAMAIGVRRVGGANLGIGITGVAGPAPSEGKPVGTVYIALADDKRVWVKEILAGHGTADRDYIRYIATSHALDMTRRYLEALPTVMAGGQLIEEVQSPKTDIPAADPTSRRHILSAVFPWKGDKPREFLLKSLLWIGILTLIILCSLALYHYVLYPEKNRDQYRDLEYLYMSETSANFSTDDFPTGMLPRFYALYLHNRDIRGWVRIEDTGISYPVVQNETRDYSRLNYERESSPYGVPYFDQNVSLERSSNRSYVIHGNNTRDGQMFSDLLRYRDAGFLMSHPLIEMNTIYEAGQFEVFAVFYADEENPEYGFDYRTTLFQDNEDFLTFVNQIQRHSLFLSDVDVQAADKLLLLSTSAETETGQDGIRLVVAARKLQQGEEANDSPNYSYNENAILPETMRSEPLTTVAYVSPPSATTRPQSSDELPDDIVIPPSPTAEPTSATLVATKTNPEATRTQLPTEKTTQSAVVTYTTDQTEESVATTSTTVNSGSEEEPTEEAFYSTIQVKIGGMPAYAIQNKAQLQYAVACAVKQEMGYARTMRDSVEAQKAQAVVSYTHMLWTCRHDQPVYTIASRINLSDTIDQKIYDAVGTVLGVKLIDASQTSLADMPLNAMYFCCGNGASANSQNVYNTELPYLQSVDSPYDTDEYIQTYSGKTESLISTYQITWKELRQRMVDFVRQKTHDEVSSVQWDTDGDSPVYATSWDGDGRYVVNTNCYYLWKGKRVYLRGIDIRRIIGTSTLKSHCFEVGYDESTDLLTFTVYGHGHGLGMSQYGAIGYANEAGWTYDQILKHYYSLSGNYRLSNPVW